MNDNYIMLNGIKIPLTEEQIKAIEQMNKAERKSPFDRVKEGEMYYFIDTYNVLTHIRENETVYDEHLYNTANYCTDESLMQSMAYHQTLNRLLLKFSYENGWNENLWKDICISKWFVSWDFRCNNFCTNRNYINKSNQVYFVSEEVAQRAIDEIVKPFCAEHWDFVW